MNALARLAMYSTHLNANDLKSLMNGVASFLSTGAIAEAPKNEMVALALESMCNEIIAEHKANVAAEARTKAMEKAYNNVLGEACALIEQTRMDASYYAEEETHEETQEEKRARISKARSEAGRKGAKVRLGISEDEANSSKSEQIKQNQANQAKSSKNEFCLAKSSKTKQNEDLLDFASTGTQELDFACEEGVENVENEAKTTENEAKSSSLSFLNFSFSSLNSLLSEDTLGNNLDNQENKNLPSAHARTRGEPPRIDLSFVRPDFLPIVEKWLDYKKNERKETYKTTSTLKTMYNKMVEDSGGDPQVADKMINRAISNRSQGFFPLTNTKNGNTAQQHTEVSLDDGRERKYVSTF